MSISGEMVTGKMGNSQSVAERYTESAKRAIFFARNECQRRGDSLISVADLLAGLGMDEDTRADRVGSLKTNAFYLRWLAGLPQLPAIASAQSEIEPDLDANAKKALAYAVVEADRDREYWIDSDHLLRGLMRFPNKAHFAVLKTEINLDSMRVASRKDREEFIPDESSSLKVVQYLIGKYATLWGPPAIGLACYLYILIQSIGLRLSPMAR